MDVYKIGVSLAMTSNAPQVLQALSAQLLHVHTQVNQLQGGLNRLKVALGGAFAVAGGTAMLATMGKVVDRGNDLVKVQQDMAAAGVKNAEVQEAYAKAWEMTAKHKNVSALEVMKIINDGRMVFGSQHDATHHVDDYAQMTSFMKAYQGGKHAEGAHGLLAEVNAAMKSGEIAGKITPAEMGEHVKQLTAMKIAYGQGVKVGDYLTSQRAAGVAMRNASDEFRYGYFPALVQENGSSAGVMLMTAFNKIAAGTGNRTKSVEHMMDLGLLNREQVEYDKNGRVKGLKSADAIKGSRMFATDPHKWVMDVLKPLLDKHTLDPIKQAQMISAMFPDRNAAKFLTEILQQHKKFEKDAKLMREARGAMAQDAYVDKSWDGQKQAFHEQWNNFVAALGAPSVGPATEALKRITEAMSGMAQWASAGEHANTLKAIGVGIAGLGASLVGAGAVAIIAALGPAGWLVLGIGTLASAILAARQALSGPGEFSKTPGATTVQNDAIPGDERFPEGPSKLTAADRWVMAFDDMKTRIYAQAAELISGIGTTITEGIQAIPERVRGILTAIETIGSEMAAAIEALPGKVTGAISAAIDGIASAFTGAIAGLAGKVGAAISGLISGVKVDSSGKNLPQTGPPRAPAQNDPAGRFGPVGKQSSYVPPARPSGGDRRTSVVQLDGRTVGKIVERRIVAERNTRNGVGGHDTLAMKTPVGWFGPVYG